MNIQKAIEAARILSAAQAAWDGGPVGCAMSNAIACHLEIVTAFVEQCANGGMIREAFTEFAKTRRDSCKNTFGGGYKTAEEREIFHHGIDTVFNVIEGHANGQRQDY